MTQTKYHIRAVTFDLWETLLLERDGWSQRRQSARCQRLTRALNKLDVNLSAEQMAQAFREMTSWLADIWRRNDEVTHLDHIQFLIQTASRGTIRMREEWIDELSTAYASAIYDVPPYLNPDARKVLKSLQEQGKLVGLICNVGLTPGYDLRRVLAENGVETYFDLTLFSDEVGIRKPHPEIFSKAAQRLNVDPPEVIHIGDNLKSDIWGATNAGFRAIHFLTDVGRDRTAESDPTSLVSISRILNTPKEETITPDKTITSLTQVIQAIHDLEANR